MERHAMSLRIRRSRLRRAASAASGVPASLLCALWVAISAASPEFVWRGLKIFLSHPNWANLLSVLLIALVLVFFIEPIMERIRERLSSPGHRGTPKHSHGSLLFTVSISLAFALTSVCLHEAMLAFVSDHGAATPEYASGLNAGIALTAAWAIVPFFVALAWQGARTKWLAVPMGIVGAASPFAAAWLFSWDSKTLLATAIPCLLILGLGYRRVAGLPTHDTFARCASVVAGVAVTWLLATLLFDAVLSALNAPSLMIYDLPSFFVDARFYLGWTVGLLLAPFPAKRPRRAA